MLDRIDNAERMADAEPRCREPRCIDYTQTATARIALEEVQAEFGIIQALVVIEGTLDDHGITGVFVPNDVHRFNRYLERGLFFAEDWERIRCAGTWVEHEIWRASVDAVTEDMAVDALREAMGE